MKDNVLKTIAEFNMLSQGDLVAVGLSGGADSVALLSLLCSLQKDLGLTLVACHVNHNLRGEESLRDERFVRSLCEKLGVECRVCSADVDKMAEVEGRSVEETARDVRYRFFAQTAGEKGKIATAHTASDNTETVLLNLTRGSGLRGLCGIPPVRDNIIRPLWGCTRSETEAWCRQNGLDWVEDSTNAEDAYTRNRLRHHVVPILRQQNSNLDNTISETSARLRRDAEYLDQLAQKAEAELTDKNGLIDREGFLQLPLPLRDRILLKMIGRCIQPSARMLELCQQTAEQGSGCLQLSEEDFFCANRHSLWTEQRGSIEKLEETAEIPVLQIGETCRVQLRVRIVELHLRQNQGSSENVYNFSLKNRLCYDRIQDALVLRTRRTGDRIRLPYRNVSKTLKKLFCEEKIPLPRRETLLVLADRGGTVLWAEEIGFSADLQPDAESKTILELTIFNGENPGEDKQL